jgi:hypothetical protein
MLAQCAGSVMGFGVAPNEKKAEGTLRNDSEL